MWGLRASPIGGERPVSLPRPLLPHLPPPTAARCKYAPGMGWGLLCELNVLLCNFEWPFNPEMHLFYWLLLYSIIKYCV